MTESVNRTCPACGSLLLKEQPSEGLCPACVLELALESPSLMAEFEQDSEAPTMDFPESSLSLGSVLGGRYRIRALLGRGGMGEVWRAFDLKLRVDVALKALRTEWQDSDRVLDLLRREVRSAREVVSPHVCRVFDLVEINGREFISMEYIDGITLWDILKARSPIDLTEARDIALQFLAGLEAIHQAGLVHRDIKPENLMMTRSGRVVVMDFGIAKGLRDGAGSMVAGTPAYMAPEQSRGETVTSRTDVFSAGVILAEMVNPSGLTAFEERQRLWEGIHATRPKIAKTVWAPVIQKAVSAVAADRYASASELARALEDVTLRVADAEATRPYPGLASFSEDDAEFFFGRELEVEKMWRKLERPHLLALIGPSGAGKSSFLRAGLLAVMPTGWRAVVTTPGDQPFASLAQALVPQFEGDAEAMGQFLRFEEPGVAVELARRWRERHDEALIIVDQFEELFTQNPQEIQTSFSELLATLGLEAGVRVLVAMRDDFLFHCSSLPALSPMFSELTPLRPPQGAALRRALVQPALKCGYRFEDEALVEEMVGEVTAERGALPLLAFAAARLWDHRDRERGLLTREAYEHIGGVGGALAQHAEATLEAIGRDELPIVRELFRNLVTAPGTRAARSREELLSVFAKAGSERIAASEVLDTLVDARLVTTYELPAADDEEAPEQRIEIIHESLLSNWPRLVRWRTQDADSAQLRDQLRQVARLWIERGRPEDLLWTGTSFKEFELWRERYAGGLTSEEEAFASAMAERTRQRRRRRRLAVAGSFVALTAVLAVVSLFWWRSEVARRRADLEALRAEAGKLVALGQLELESFPTATLAYALKSLELSDTPEGRDLATAALLAGPPVTSLQGSPERMQLLDFSASGEWLASSGLERIVVHHQMGGEPREMGLFPRTGSTIQAVFGQGDVLVTDPGSSRLRWQSVPDGRTLRELDWEENLLVGAGPDRFLTISGNDSEWRIDRWPFGEGEPRALGRVEAGQWSAVDATSDLVAYGRDHGVYLRFLEGPNATSTLVGEHAARVRGLAFAPDAKTIAAIDASGEIRIWSTIANEPRPISSLKGDKTQWIAYGPTGRWLATHEVVDGNPLIRLWDLRAPDGARPLELRRTDHTFANDLAFHPTLPWLVGANHEVAGFWPLLDSYPWILEEGSMVSDVAFTPDGEWVLSASGSRVRAWPLNGQNGGVSRVLLERSMQFPDLAIDLQGHRFAVGTKDGHLMVAPVGGGAPRELEAFPSEQTTVAGSVVAFSPNGKRLAAAPRFGPPEELSVRVWDLETEESWTFRPGPWETVNLHFLDDQRLLWSASGQQGGGGERVFHLESGRVEVVEESTAQFAWIGSRDGSFAISTQGVLNAFELFYTDRSSRERRQYRRWGDMTFSLALGPRDAVLATGGWDGTVRIGRLADELPYLLGTHEGLARCVAVSPNGQWVASGGDDGTVRIWPMPDLSRPPLQARPLEELLATVRSLTNLRVVEADSASGWRLIADPFPGWAEVPSW